MASLSTMIGRIDDALVYYSITVHDYAGELNVIVEWRLKQDVTLPDDAPEGLTAKAGDVVRRDAWINLKDASMMAGLIGGSL